MAYSELIKNFGKIRAYMRDFYIYGFKSRNEYDRKSARSYDNEKRRIESWLGIYMSFHQDSSGKNVFLSVDSRNITSNPLYEAFKAKSFTDRDIILHFYILDMLADGACMTTKEMMDKISEEYLAEFQNVELPDESSLRRKLKEYEKSWVVKSEKIGKTVCYSLCDSDISLDEWQDAVAFYSEEDPLGVIGSYIGDRMEDNPEFFSFKHHYILHALDSEVLYKLLTAIGEKKKVLIDIKCLHQKEVFPVKILISTQTGRQYLLAYYYAYSEFIIYRIDNITDVKAVEQEGTYEKIAEAAEVYMKHLWGVSSGGKTLDHIEMTVHIDPWEQHIPRRLEREKRNGRVEKIDRCTYRYIADVYDAMEMLPWLRTFIGRVQELKCTNVNVTKIFYDDLKTMQEMYGGDEDAVQ